MIWGLLITSPAERDLRHVPSDDLKRLNVAFDDMADDPYGMFSFIPPILCGLFRKYCRLPNAVSAYWSIASMIVWTWWKQ
jgi:hypothetical protein